nr:uncharacterized protein LOC111512332 [Leptinotarsa decemlineata]
MYSKISEKLNEDNFIKMPMLGQEEAKGILMSSVMQYNHSVNSKIQDCVLKSVQECTIPLYSKVLAWQTSWWVDKEHAIIPKGNVNDQLNLMLEELEAILGVTQVQHALAILTSTKHGITDSEMIDLLAFDGTFHSNTTYVSWAPACLAWSRLNKHLAPFVQWTLTGGVLGIQWKDNMLRQAVSVRYKEHRKWANQMLFDYYNHIVNSFSSTSRYMLDSDSQPPCYRLRPISCHIPGFKETSLEDREKAFAEWATEIDKMLAVLITVFSPELRDTYLTTVVEQEVHNTVFMSQELAKRCVWLNRVYTPTAKTPDNMTPGEAEAHRRLNVLQKDLKNQLTEKHMIRIPVKYVDGGLNQEIPEHEDYIATVTHHLKKHLSEMISTIVDEHQSKSLLKPSYGIEASLFEELNQQTNFCQKAAQCNINREETIEDIKSYVFRKYEVRDLTGK